MMKRNHWIFLLLTLFVLAASMLAIPASATSHSLLNGEITVADSANSSSVSGTTVTITAKGSLFSKKTNNITITNNTESTAKLTFTYTVSKYSSFTIAGASASENGKYQGMLDAGASVAIALTSNSGLSNTTATLTLSDFSLTAVADSANITVSFDNTLGSVTADGTSVTSGATQDVSSSGISLVATPKSGMTFLGWIDANTHERLSELPSFTLKPTGDMTVMPVFVKASDIAWFLSGGSYLFDDLSEAATFASTVPTKTVILMNNGTLPAGNYTIPSGVTLLIPFDSDNTLYTTDPGEYGTGYVKPTVYRQLTMAEGACITVNGSISLSAKVKTGQASKLAGGPSGPCSYIYMNQGSSITINSGGALYVWGFVYGSGTVTAKNGANVYECFQFTDFRGGTQTTSMKNEVFPISQYYVQNVEVPMTIEAGASLKTAACFTVSIVGTQQPVVNFIGSSSSFFTLTSGSVTKYYDGATDRTVMEINGTASLAPITMKVSLSSINSDDYVMPLNSNITIKIKSGSNVEIKQDLALLPGTQIIVDSGANCSLGSGTRLYVYDADQWGNYCASADKPFIAVDYAPGRTYTRTQDDLVDAYIEVNGTVDASLGYVYTTAGGANIHSTGTGVIKLKPGTATVTYQLVQSTSTYDNIPITAAKLKNSDGSYITSATNTYTYIDGYWRCATHSYDAGVNTLEPNCYQDGIKTFTCSVCAHSYTDPIAATGAHVDADTDGHCDTEGCTYEFEYCDHANTTVLEGYAATCTTSGLTNGLLCNDCGLTLTAQTEIPAIGHAYNTELTTPPTCEELGVNTHTCGNCGDTYTEDVAALGHDIQETVSKPATCTEYGDTTYTCTRCDYSETKTNIKPIPHTEETIPGKDATCTETGLTEGKKCSVCGNTTVEQTEIAALGHSYNAVVTEPTCTEQGYTTHTCSKCGDSYKDTYTDATGHTEVTVPGKDATCTETGLTEGKKCSVCGVTTVEQTEIAALGHSYNAVVTDPTCTEQGYTTHTCSKCGDSYKDTYTDATGHTEVTVPGKDATCTETGLTEGKKCSVCGVTTVEQTTIATLGHTEVTVPGKAATCTETGLTEGKKCSVCGVTTVAQTEIAAQGHTEVHDCDHNERWTTCSSCGNELSREKRQYEITFQGITDAYTTILSGCTYAADGAITAPNMNSACFAFTGNWLVNGTEFTAGSEISWAALESLIDTTPGTTDDTIEIAGSYVISAIKPEAIYLTVNVGTEISATIHVYADPGLSLENSVGIEFVPQVESEQQVVYKGTVTIEADKISDLDKQDAPDLIISYGTIDGTEVTKKLDSIMLIYLKAINDMQSTDESDAALVNNILAYGGAVRSYFYGESYSDWADLSVSSEELANYHANYNINTVDHGKGMVKIVAANVNFRTDYKMRYSFTVNGIDTEKVTGYGVIVSEDAAGQNVVSKHEYQGKLANDPNKAGRYLVTYMVDAADITKDLYVTVYVKYTDGETEVTEQSQTMQYGLYKFLTRSIYKYSPTGGGAKVTGDTDGTKTAQYVAMLNSLLKFGEKYDNAG